MKNFFALIIFLLFSFNAQACQDSSICPKSSIDLNDSWDKADLKKARRLGFLYNYCFQDEEKELLWARRAAEIGTAEDVHGLAILLEARKKSTDETDAPIEEFLKAAKKGNLDSQYFYALYLLKKDAASKEAIDWLETAGRSGHIPAADRLGNIYRNNSFPEKSLAWHALSDCMRGVDIRTVPEITKMTENMEDVQKQNARLIYCDISSNLKERKSWCKNTNGVYELLKSKNMCRIELKP